MIDIQTTKDIGNLVKTARKEQGLTQPDLAGVAGTGLRFIVELEKGKPTAQVEKVLTVMRTLGLSLKVDKGET